jgi:O-succinylhomoserine sulfhydrylase
MVVARAAFGPTRWVTDNLLPRFGIERDRRLSTARDLEAWKAAIRPNTKVFFFETPANPTMDIVDTSAAVSAQSPARMAFAPWWTMPFRTPALQQRPLDFGADVVAYSATKLMDGQGRVLAGAVCGSAEFINETCCCRSSAIPGQRCRRSTPGWC